MHTTTWMGHAQRHHNNTGQGYVEGEVGSCLIVNQNSSQLNKHPTTLVGNLVLPVLPGKTAELRRFSSAHNTRFTMNCDGDNLLAESLMIRSGGKERRRRFLVTTDGVCSYDRITLMSPPV